MFNALLSFKKNSGHQSSKRLLFYFSLLVQEVLEFNDNKADILNVSPRKFDFNQLV